MIRLGGRYVFSRIIITLAMERRGGRVGGGPAMRESAEKEGRKEFWVHETKHDGFRLMLRPAALSKR
jgi:hypothetical protein